MGDMTGMSFYLTRLFRVVVCKISILHHRRQWETQLPSEHVLVPSSNRNTREICKIFLKLTMKAPE